MSLSSHFSKIKKKVQISTSLVESGMIVSCKYSNRNKQVKSYLVICINPNYKGEFHCYKLNNFTTNDIIMLAARYGTKEKRGIDYINISNPKSFYNSIKGIGGRDFKRFNPSKMSGTRVCVYDYEMKI